jgi:hypothetical protein
LRDAGWASDGAWRSAWNITRRVLGRVCARAFELAIDDDDDDALID